MSEYGGSQISRFGKSSNLNQKRTYGQINGQLVPLVYDIKFMVDMSLNGTTNLPGTIKIQIPQLMLTQSQGDKVVTIKYLQFFYFPTTTGMSVSDAMNQKIRITAQNQKNNFDQTGNQTNIIGFMTYDPSKYIYQADCQPFEMDSKIPVVINLEVQQPGTSSWKLLDTILNGDLKSYIYLDVQLQFEENI